MAKKPPPRTPRTPKKREPTAPAPAAPPTVAVLPIGALKPDPGNARIHGDRNRQTIRGSLARFGAGRSLVLDGKNVVRAGNGTLAEAEAEGFTEVLVVEPQPGQLVAVRRPEWSETEATGYAIADNRAADQAEYDNTVLAQTLEALRSEPDFDATAVGYSGEEIDGLLEGLAAAIAGPVDGGAAAEPTADVGTPIRRITMCYCDEDEPALRAFALLPTDGPLPENLGAFLLARIKAQSAT